MILLATALAADKPLKVDLLPDEDAGATTLTAQLSTVSGRDVTIPFSVSIRLLGLMSRWMTPRLCA